jgi:hypothetical protein
VDADDGVFGLNIIHPRGVLADAQMLVHGIDRHHAFAAVDTGQSGKQFLHARRERTVGMLQAGEAGVAAERWNDLAEQQCDAGWLRHPGKVHVPLFADHLAGVVGLADEADNVLVAVDRRVNGIAAERAEPAGDRMECRGRQILIAYRQHAIMMQRAAQFLKGGIVRSGGQVDPAHLCAEGSGNRQYLEPLETYIAQHRRHLLRLTYT